MRYILHWVREGLVHCSDSPRGCGECERLLWQFAVQSGLTTTTHKRRKFWYNFSAFSEEDVGLKNRAGGPSEMMLI